MMTFRQGLFAARSHIAVVLGLLLAWGAVLAFGPARRVGKAQPRECAGQTAKEGR
jgi:hypothetical protein